ncbi:MAG: YceD family protein [Acidimicrobiales bacterium]
MTSPDLVPVARLRRRAHSTLRVAFEAPFDESHEFAARGPAETDVFAEATVSIDLTLASYPGGVRATGTVAAPWHGVCRRCSTPVLGMSSVRVAERFVDDRAEGDDDAYAIVDDQVDLAQLAHDAILLDLPLAPLCREECAGLCPICGVDRNDERCDCRAERDPRWAMLDGLRFEGETASTDAES